VERLRAALEAHYDRIVATQTGARPEERGYVNRLTKPLVAALDKALDRYKEHEEARAKAAAVPAGG